MSNLDTTFHDTLLHGIANALHCSNWADRVEECTAENTVNLSQMDITEIATTPTDLAVRTAAHLLGVIEEHNQINMLLFFNKKIEDLDTADDKFIELFGHYLAMQALGSGVRWSDSHEDHNLEIPYIEFYEDLPIEDLTD